MIYEIRTSRAVKLDPNNAQFTLSQQAQMRLVGFERRQRGVKVKKTPLQAGVTSVGPFTQVETYKVEVSEDLTRGTLITSIASRVIGEMSMRGPLPPSFTPEISREEIAPNMYIPLGVEKIAWLASIRARAIRREIRTRFFVANISNNNGSSPAEPSAPVHHVPLSPVPLAV